MGAVPDFEGMLKEHPADHNHSKCCSAAMWGFHCTWRRSRPGGGAGVQYRWLKWCTELSMVRFICTSLTTVQHKNSVVLFVFTGTFGLSHLKTSHWTLSIEKWFHQLETRSVLFTSVLNQGLIVWKITARLKGECAICEPHIQGQKTAQTQKVNSHYSNFICPQWRKMQWIPYSVCVCVCVFQTFCRVGQSTHMPHDGLLPFKWAISRAHTFSWCEVSHSCLAALGDIYLKKNRSCWRMCWTTCSQTEVGDKHIWPSRLRQCGWCVRRGVPNHVSCLLRNHSKDCTQHHYV